MFMAILKYTSHHLRKWKCLSTSEQALNESKTCIWLRRAVAVARATRKYGVPLRLRRFHYMRDLIRCNLAGTIDGNERLVYYAMRRYFSRRLVTIHRRKNGERFSFTCRIKERMSASLSATVRFRFVHREHRATECNGRKFLVCKKYSTTRKFKVSFSFFFPFLSPLPFRAWLSVNCSAKDGRRW